MKKKADPFRALKSWIENGDAVWTGPDAFQQPAGRVGRPEDIAAMALYLSAGLSRQVQEELLAGGYPEDTPAAVVYRATWPEEKTLRCTVGTLAQTMEANGIDRTALIVVGDCLGECPVRSKLYDPDFSTGYREARP